MIDGEDPPPPPPFLLPGLWPERALTLLSGPGGAGKTLLLFQRLLQLARGKLDWASDLSEDLYFNTNRPMNTLFVTAEDPERVMKNRVPRDEYRTIRDEVKGHFHGWQCKDYLWHVDKYGRGSPGPGWYPLLRIRIEP